MNPNVQHPQRPPGPMICPRCGGSMAVFQRSQVLVQFCQRCGGVFLPVQDLDRIVAIETAARTPNVRGHI